MFRLYLDCSLEIITSLSCHPPNHKIPRDHFIRTGRHRGGAEGAARWILLLKGRRGQHRPPQGQESSQKLTLDISSLGPRWADPGAGSCWRRSGTTSSWGSPWASGRWGWAASWAGAWCPAACWEVSGGRATARPCPPRPRPRAGCGPWPCGGVATSRPGRPGRGAGRAWCGGWSRAEEDKMGGGRAGADSGPWLEDCAGWERSGSRGLPFLLVIPPRRRGWGSLRAEAGPDLRGPSCGPGQPSSASCTWIAYFETRSSPET